MFVQIVTHVWFFRYLTADPGNNQWKSFSEDDYKLNVRVFRRYLILDQKIMSCSASLAKLAVTDDATIKRAKKRFLEPDSDSPVKFKYKVSADTSTESDEDEDEDEDQDQDQTSTTQV